MKVCYKCGHHTEKSISIPIIIKYFARDDDNCGSHFDSWKLEVRPYCCFCTDKKTEEDIDNVIVEDEYQPERI